jgi:inosine-uridine nucleoside N-ribohydrolase
MHRLLIALLLLGHLTAMSQTQRVWLDTDMSSGKWFGDMDDALALLYLLNDTTVNIAGISVVHGVKHADRITRQLLLWYAPERNINVHIGADSQREIGVRTAAVNALEHSLSAGKLNIIALGPATNIASLLQLRPDLADSIASITFCAGRTAGKTFTPTGGKVRFSDYNFEHDTAAARILLESKVPLVLAGYECAEQLMMRHEHYAHLRKSAHKGDRWLYRKLKRWENVWRTFFGVRNGFIPFDVATVEAALRPQGMNIRSITAGITLAESDSRSIIKSDEKPYLTVFPSGDGRVVSFCAESPGELLGKLLISIERNEP